MLTQQVIKPYVMATGTKYFSEYRDYIDEGISWIVLKNFDVYGCYEDDEILEVLDMCRYYAGPGQMYAGTPLLKRTFTRILITQRVGYDV